MEGSPGNVNSARSPHYLTGEMQPDFADETVETCVGGGVGETEAPNIGLPLTCQLRIPGLGAGNLCNSQGDLYVSPPHCGGSQCPWSHLAQCT